ncbi:hypothetical protein D3C87_1617400 [compost metagenome]
MVVTLVVRQEDAITSQLLRAAANDDVEKQPTMGNTVQRGGQPRIIGRRGNARTDGDEEFQFLGIGGEIGREDEGFLAGDAGRNKHPGITEPIRSLRYFPKIAGIGGT